MGRAFSPFVLLAALVVPARALAAPAPCDHVVADPKLGEAWDRAAAALNDDLASKAVDCGAATIRIESVAERVRVVVTAADGRRAERSASSPPELAAIVEGVVASIPPEERSIVASPPVPRAAAVAAAPPPELVPASAESAKQIATMGATFGTRLGLPTSVLSTELEIRGDIELSRWVISLSGRVAPSGTRLRRDDATDSEYTELSLGVLLGRTTALGQGALTATLGPRVGTMTHDADQGVSRHRRDLWLQVALRYVLPVGDRWRPAISLEVEGAATRLMALNAPSLADFPSCSAALRVGVIGTLF